MASAVSSRSVRVLESRAKEFAPAWADVCQRRLAGSEDVEKAARKIIERVRVGGNPELLACIKQFDGAQIEAVEVSPAEWEEACEAVDPAVRAVMGTAVSRVRAFHRKRIPSSWEMREEGGAYMGQRLRPLQRVGLYVPGGKALYPSSVIMTATPASIVEVPEIVMATPPAPDGSICPEVLLAARLAGVHRVFKMGGAHAVAALAFGTQSVPRVDKIVGPGGIWVATAKRLVFGEVGIDSEAGPTEVCVVADASATPAWVAADLISQAEHDEVAQAVLITHTKGLVSKVEAELKKQLEKLERAEIARTSLSSRGAIVVTRNLEESITLANEYASEHLVLCVENPEAALKQVTNAGSVFLGHYTPVAVGDYLAGPNHVLPTAGTARFFSPLGIEDFLKRTSFVQFDASKLRELGPDVMKLAEVEGLTGHGTSVDLRLESIKRARKPRASSGKKDS